MHGLHIISTKTRLPIRSVWSAGKEWKVVITRKYKAQGRDNTARKRTTQIVDDQLIPPFPPDYLIEYNSLPSRCEIETNGLTQIIQ